MTKLFTTDNTDGFDATDLVILNDAATIIEARNPSIREYSIVDAITNAWVGDQTAEELAAATGL